MKFVITQGCTAFNFTVDEKSYNEMPREEQEKVIDYVLADLKKKLLENHIGLQGIMEHYQYDSYEVGPKCESCGDSVSTIIINV